jgi:hypothetical protein
MSAFTVNPSLLNTTLDLLGEPVHPMPWLFGLALET